MKYHSKEGMPCGEWRRWGKLKQWGIRAPVGLAFGTQVSVTKFSDGQTEVVEIGDPINIVPGPDKCNAALRQIYKLRGECREPMLFGSPPPKPDLR